MKKSEKIDGKIEKDDASSAIREALVKIEYLDLGSGQYHCAQMHGNQTVICEAESYIIDDIKRLVRLANDYFLQLQLFEDKGSDVPF